MARMVNCVKLGREAEGLDFPPVPGELGKRIWENVSKEAWAGWLKQHAGPRIGLIGHSSGALKCLYAEAHEPDPAVKTVVALPPPRLSYRCRRA